MQASTTALSVVEKGKKANVCWCQFLCSHDDDSV